MPTITIDGKPCEFAPGETILQVALRNAVAIPYYCYHPGLSIVASCRICLAEVWAPNPRNNNALEPLPKLVPTCQTTAGDGQVVYSSSPRAVQNQKAVMEYLLINHPLDCPVCDQAGECLLQDYSYEYGRSVSRFEEDKIKQPKKDLGPNVLLYADRCIMCSRCVRFTREVTGTAELTVEGRGAFEQIDVFPGRALDNELASNVIDICPVGALLDKDFLFAQRVWYLKSTPSIDGLTASGDNLWVEHNEGRVYRLKPRENPSVNRWWITDEVRYGWAHVHSEKRLSVPTRREFGVPVAAEFERAVKDAVAGLRAAPTIGALISPMLSTEDAFLLARAVAEIAAAANAKAVFAVGPVVRDGEDRVYPPNAKPVHEGGNGFVVRAEKAPNARGVRRALRAVAAAEPLDARDFAARAARGEFKALLLTGNYPAEWAPDDLLRAVDRAAAARPFTVVLDTLAGRLVDAADVVLPACTWLEKAGSFENATGRVQSFERAIPPLEGSRPEGQIALDMLREILGGPPRTFDAEVTRGDMADASPDLRAALDAADHAPAEPARTGDMAVVEL